jgi:hypothetical protein
MDAPHVQFTRTSDGVRIAYGPYEGSGSCFWVQTHVDRTLPHHIPA